MSQPIRALGLATAALLGLSACVVTPYEGPGEPPRHPGKPLPEPGAEEAQRSDGPSQVHARHLLVAYQGATRAASGVTRTRDEAYARATEALNRAQSGEDFGQLVAEYSDEPGAAERGGDLGFFRRDQMVRRFADAAFALKPGEISNIVETEFGFHVIQRVE